MKLQLAADNVRDDEKMVLDAVNRDWRCLQLLGWQIRMCSRLMPDSCREVTVSRRCPLAVAIGCLPSRLSSQGFGPAILLDVSKLRKIPGKIGPVSDCSTAQVRLGPGPFNSGRSFPSAYARPLCLSACGKRSL